jgi:hypothetical protein
VEVFVNSEVHNAELKALVKSLTHVFGTLADHMPRSNDQSILPKGRHGSR